MPAKNSTYYKDLSRAANRPLPVDDEYVVTLTVVNMPEFQLPMTGGRGLALSGQELPWRWPLPPRFCICSAKRAETKITSK